MNEFEKYLIALLIGFFLLVVLWIQSYGLTRALLAGLCRIAWCAPVMLAVFPEAKTDLISKALTLKTIHLLDDDSLSMQDTQTLARRRSINQELSDLCLRLACRVETVKLSELSDQVGKGFTPLGDVMKSWLPMTHQEPWILFSDGGDSQPSQPWSGSLKNTGKSYDKSLGLVLASSYQEDDNVWLEITGGPDFGFDQKPLSIELQLHRRSKLKSSALKVQIQASILGKNINSMNVSFRPNEEEISVSIPLPPLQRGTHLVKFNILPIAHEKIIWDNSASKSIEIMPNTIGILHLLGSPSWDGRFVRRYLKSEPKYDLVSFFILRDPSDVQLTNERDLSLIPFPVERLFNEELPNFRAVVIQDFSLYQFLEPDYQKNLVDFVLNGGGLLFIGGPRALKDIDLTTSPLASLLPFQIKASKNRDSQSFQDQGIVAYDHQAKFGIRSANPKQEKRLLANIFEDWKNLDFSLENNQSYQGLHRLDRVELAEEGFTPLLMAKLSDGRESLLAAASYPGKGRAVWLFSDSLWKLALNPATDSSREIYHSFLKSSMTWLLREEMQRPLWLQDLVLQEHNSEMLWSVKVRGPAAKYLGDAETWTFRVCGQYVTGSTLERKMVSTDQWLLSGRIKTNFAPGSACEVQIEGRHMAFGTVKASLYAIVPEIFSDKNMEGSYHRLQSLSVLTGAQFIDLENPTSFRQIEVWMKAVLGKMSVLDQSEQKVTLDYYWVLSRWWGFMLVIFLPLEVLIRRWRSIFGSESRPAFEPEILSKL